MYKQLVEQYPLVSDQLDKHELTVLLRELEDTLTAGVEGDVAEFGCYVGTVSLFIQRMLAALSSQKKLHVYDSFEGLPAKTARDESVIGEGFVSGELAADKRTLTKNFKRAGLQLPVIHKGWFDRLELSDVPDAVCFAFLDGDFYESIHDSLGLVWPKLSRGATVVVDDYQSESLPGAGRAVDDWLASHTARLRVESSLAILTPRST